MHSPDIPLKGAQALPPRSGDKSPGSGYSPKSKPEPPQGLLFKEVNELRQYKDGDDEEVNISRKYKDDCFGRVAGNTYFELLTFFFIGLNSLYIGYDADYAAQYGKPDDPYSPDMPWGFIVMENIFAVYFTLEVVIRFLAYKNKCDCFFDGWFIFDFILVSFMVLETWILPLFGLAGPLAQFSVLRLLRLLRISRMARLMKKCPELMIIIKGLIASVRSVGCTAILLILCLYVWAILFVTEYHEGWKSEDELDDTIHYHFGTLARSMFTLFIMGTVLDDVTVATTAIRKTGNGFMLTLFILFILISSFTILNMLIGILCEVVSATAEREKTKSAQASLKEAIKTIFKTLDQDGSGCISREEFVLMRSDPSVREALKEMDIAERHFQKYCEILFQKPNATIDYDNLIRMLLRLRPENHVSALDLSLLEASLDRSQENMKERIQKIKEMMSAVVAAGPPRSGSKQNVGTQDVSDGSVVASSAVTRITATGEGPPPPPVDVTKQYPLEMFVRISSDEIIEELERRLGVSAVGPKKDSTLR
jgi:hypothetical protein